MLSLAHVFRKLMDEELPIKFWKSPGSREEGKGKGKRGFV